MSTLSTLLSCKFATCFLARAFGPLGDYIMMIHKSISQTLQCIPSFFTVETTFAESKNIFKKKSQMKASSTSTREKKRNCGVTHTLLVLGQFIFDSFPSNMVAIFSQPNSAHTPGGWKTQGEKDVAVRKLRLQLLCWNWPFPRPRLSRYP